MSTQSPNMNLTIPSVGVTGGPEYANDINSSLTIIDQHDHSNGSGVPISPSGMNISSALTFQNNFATELAGLTLQAQVSTPANNTIYEAGVDLYFVDGLGNNIRLTESGAVAGTPGSIANLVSPASASYVSVSSTFVWRSDVGIAANMDAGSILMRNLSPNSTFALTLSPPAALGANYTITLPALPASTKIMALTSSGAMSAPYSVDNSSVIIDSNVIKVGPLGITTSMIANQAVESGKIANLAVSTAQLANAAVTAGKLANNSVETGKIVNSAVDSSKIATNIDLPGNRVALGSKLGVVSNSPPTTGDNLAVSRARVNSAGSVLSGEGTTVSKLATGTYRIDYTNFADIPAVVVTPETSSTLAVRITNPTVAQCDIEIFNTSTGTLTDSGFHYFAIGSRT